MASFVIELLAFASSLAFFAWIVLSWFQDSQKDEDRDSAPDGPNDTMVITTIPSLLTTDALIRSAMLQITTLTLQSLMDPRPDLAILAQNPRVQLAANDTGVTIRQHIHLALTARCLLGGFLLSHVGSPHDDRTEIAECDLAQDENPPITLNELTQPSFDEDFRGNEDVSEQAVNNGDSSPTRIDEGVEPVPTDEVTEEGDRRGVGIEPTREGSKDAIPSSVSHTGPLLAFPPLDAGIDYRGEISEVEDTDDEPLESVTNPLNGHSIIEDAFDDSHDVKNPTDGASIDPHDADTDNEAEATNSEPNLRLIECYALLITKEEKIERLEEKIERLEEALKKSEAARKALSQVNEHKTRPDAIRLSPTHKSAEADHSRSLAFEPITTAADQVAKTRVLKKKSPKHIEPALDRSVDEKNIGNPTKEVSISDLSLGFSHNIPSPPVDSTNTSGPRATYSCGRSLRLSLPTPPGIPRSASYRGIDRMFPATSHTQSRSKLAKGSFLFKMFPRSFEKQKEITLPIHPTPKEPTSQPSDIPPLIPTEAPNCSSTSTSGQNKGVPASTDLIDKLPDAPKVESSSGNYSTSPIVVKDDLEHHENWACDRGYVGANPLELPLVESSDSDSVDMEDAPDDTLSEKQNCQLPSVLQVKGHQGCCKKSDPIRTAAKAHKNLVRRFDWSRMGRSLSYTVSLRRIRAAQRLRAEQESDESSMELDDNSVFSASSSLGTAPSEMDGVDLGGAWEGFLSGAPETDPQGQVQTHKAPSNAVVGVSDCNDAEMSEDRSRQDLVPVADAQQDEEATTQRHNARYTVFTSNDDGGNMTMDQDAVDQSLPQSETGYQNRGIGHLPGAETFGDGQTTATPFHEPSERLSSTERRQAEQDFAAATEESPGHSPIPTVAIRHEQQEQAESHRPSFTAASETKDSKENMIDRSIEHNQGHVTAEHQQEDPTRQADQLIQTTIIPSYGTSNFEASGSSSAPPPKTASIPEPTKALGVSEHEKVVKAFSLAMAGTQDLHNVPDPDSSDDEDGSGELVQQPDFCITEKERLRTRQWYVTKPVIGKKRSFQDDEAQDTPERRSHRQPRRAKLERPGTTAEDHNDAVVGTASTRAEEDLIYEIALIKQRQQDIKKLGYLEERTPAAHIYEDIDSSPHKNKQRAGAPSPESSENEEVEQENVLPRRSSRSFAESTPDTPDDDEDIGERLLRTSLRTPHTLSRDQ
ncbi:MAG: hypothetical protein Q9222_001775 [Ikaeria aurantiellina]